ncbi:MAG: LamG-like jellyroll fold domain-containing protein [Henriciella sp.]
MSDKKSGTPAENQNPAQDPAFVFGDAPAKKKIDAWEGEGEANIVSDSGEMALANLHFGTTPEAEFLKANPSESDVELTGALADGEDGETRTEVALEENAEGAIIGALSSGAGTSDASQSYTISDDRFEVVDGELRLLEGVSLNFEEAASLEVTVTTTDEAGDTTPETFIINVIDTNDAPQDLSLDGASVAENDAGAVIGTLSSFDPDGDLNVTYTVSDARFEVVAGELRLADGESLDHEEAATIDLTVTAIDSGGLETSETFTVDVLDVNEGPSDLALDGNSVTENDGGAVVGTLSSFDPDAGDSVTYTASDDRFEVVDGELRLAEGVTLDHEEAASIDVTVTATDTGGLTTEETFSVDVVDVNEGPTDLALDGNSVAENDAGAVVGTLSSFDPDAGDSVSYTVSDDRFEIVDGELRVAEGVSLDHEEAASIDVSVTATDSGGLTTEETFSVDVVDVNEGPTDLALDGNSVAENDTGAVVGTLSSFDPDAGDSVSYTVSDDRFEIVDGELRVAEGVSLDHEEAASIEVTVTATDTGGLTTEETFSVDVVDVNEGPTDLALDGNSVAENDTGAVVGTLSSFDPDAGDSVSYTVSDDRFEIVDGELRVAEGVSLDHEDAASIDVSVTATDSGGLTTEETFTVDVVDVNEGPTDLALDGNSVAENDTGAVVGTLSSFDPDAGDSVSYTTSDDRFEIVDGELRVAEGVSLDHEEAASIEVTVTATDSGGLSTEETFSVDVVDVNEGPTDLALDGNSVAENDAGAVVGTLSSFDPDAGDSVSYTVSDDRFEIVDGELRVAEGVSLDHEEAASIDVSVTATDSGGLTTEETFSVDVVDVNEGPTDLALDGNSVSENDAGAVVGTLSSFDPDAGDSVTYTTSDDRFEIVDGELRVAEGVSLDHEEAASIDVSVTATDSGGLTTEETFTVDVVDVNEGPTDLALDGNSVSENDAGAVVGTLSSFDPDAGDSVSYTTSDDRFEIVDGELRVAEGVSLDHEEAASIEVTVTATDSGGLTTEETFSVDVVDVNEAPSDLALDGATIDENDAGAVIGNLSSTDPDAGDTITYSVSDDRFEIVDGQLQLADGVSFDHETTDSVDVEIIATDEGGLSTSETFSLNVADVNEAPVDLTLTRETGLAEADFSAADGYSGSDVQSLGLESDVAVFTMSFTTADDVGSAQTLFESGGSGTGINVVIEDGMLQIYAGNGNDLEVSVPIEAETEYGFALELDTDSNTIRVLLSDELPLSEMNAENSLAASADNWTDNDYSGGNSMGVGDEAGGSSQGRTGGEFQGEIDGPGLQIFSDSSLEDVFIEAGVAENTEGAVVGTLSAFDPDAGDSLTFTVSDDRFEVVDGELRLAEGVTLDHEEADSINVTVTATDEGGLSTSESFDVDVVDLNEGPTDLALDTNSIDENSTEGVIGTVSVTDPDAGDTHTYELVDNDGGPFAIDAETGEISVVSPGIPDNSVLRLDASDEDSVTQDGGVSTIQDLSGGDNTVRQTNADEQPDLTEDGPFGAPGLLFDGVNDHLDIADDSAINLSSQGERSFGMTIQTGDDVETRQVIFEEGGTVNGFNFYIDDGELYMGAWSESTGWSFEAVSVEVEADTPYSIVTVYDGASNSYTAYVNGENVGSVEVGDTMSGHSGNIGLGGLAQHTVFHDGSSSSNDGYNFGGSVGEFVIYNDALESQDVAAMDMEFRGISADLDAETQDSYDVTVQVTDAAGESYTETVTIDVNDLNEAPEDLALDGNSVAENDAGAVVGTLSATDQDAGDSVSYTVSDDRFEIVDGELRLAEGESLDHEEAASIEVTVTATDGDGLSTEETFSVDVADVNEGPTDLSLDGNSVDENDAGATVGTLSSFDPDAGDSVAYTVSDDRFEVVDGELRVAEGVSLDHEEAASIDVSVTATDRAGLETTETFSVDVADVNEGPSDLSLDGNSVDENDAGAAVGTLSSFDPDAGDSVAYTVSDDRFEVVDGELRVAEGVSLDHEEAASIDVSVTATDGAGLETTETFSVEVADVNEGPTNLALDGNSVDENDTGAAVGTLSSFDPDAGDSVAYTVSDDRFEVVDGELRLAEGESLDHEAAESLDITVTATDNDGLSTSESFTVDVADVNEAPSDLEVSSDGPEAGAFLEQGGLLVIEAENYNTSTDGSGGHAWGESDTEGMMHVDDGANAYDGWVSESSVESDSPELAYSIHIETPGTYYVHVGGAAEDGPTGNADSVHIGIDGERITDNGGLTGFRNVGDWGSTDTYTREAVEVTFDEPGTYELNLWAREDGVSVDQIVLTQDENFVPSDDLVESPRAGDLSVDENDAGAVVGTVTAFDPDAGDSMSFTVSDDRFEVVDGELRLAEGETLDHEEASSIDVSVTATDGGGLETTETFSVDVADVNEGPSDLALDGNSVAENDAGATVGTLTSFDPDAGDSVAYTVSDDRFEIVDGELRVAEGVSLDHEEAASIDVSVTATDAAGLETTETFSVDVADVNEGPSDLALDGNSVAENDAGGVVGTLSSFDPDAGDSVSYSVSDDRFEVVDGELRLADGESLDHEEASSIDVSVTATDASGLETSETFTVDVVDVNEAPTDVQLTAQDGVLSLNQDGGTDDNAISANMTDFPSDAITVEVTFTADGPPEGSGAPLFSYADGTNGHGNDVLLWAESSSGDLNVFLDGQKFPTDIPNSDLFDGEEHTVSFTWDQASGDLTVYVDGAEEYSRVVNVGEIGPDGTVTLGQEQDSEGGRYDSGQIFEGEIAEVRIYDEALTEDAIADNAAGDVSQEGLVTHWVMDEANDGVVSDLAGDNDLVLENGAEIVDTVDDGALSVAENDAGAVVGTVSSFDPDAGDSVTYSVSDDRFEVVDGEVRLADGETLDHEEAASIEIVVTATDEAGLSSDETFTVDVADVNEAPMDLAFETPSENLITGGSFEEQNVSTGKWSGFSEDASGNWESANGIEVWDNLGGTAASDGEQFLELDFGGAADAISQTVSTDAGQTYSLSFDMRARGESTTDTIEVFWNNEQVGVFDPASTDWEDVSFDVVGTGGSDVLEFREAEGESDGYGAHLDNISLVEVPLTLVENVAGGEVGSFSVFDPDAGDTISYSVSDDRFEIVDGDLRLSDDASLDYEAEQSVDVTVTATDEGGLETSETVTIEVLDVDEGAADTNTITGGTGDDVLIGGEGDDLFIYEMDGGSDTIDGGASWTDTIDISDALGQDAVFGQDWTLTVTEGEIVSETADSITLSDDASGFIEFDNGESIDFSNIEQIGF